MNLSKSCISRVGLFLLVLAVSFGAIGLRGAIHERFHKRDLESKVQELRANGAIVENYYEILGDTDQASSSTHWLLFCSIAVILVVLGAATMVMARRDVLRQ